MKNYLLLTNNPRVQAECAELPIQAHQNAEDVMIAARDLIHRGYLLVTHPLAGSVKPAQTPYRSIILEEHRELDYRSLQLMENALQKFYQFKKTHIERDYPQKILEDYQAIDASLIENAITSLF